MEREQPLGPIRAAVGRRLDEEIHGGAELERQFLDAFAQLVPRVESVFARDDRLRVVQGQRAPRQIGVGGAGERRQDAESREGAGVVGAGGAQQIFRLPLELIEIRALG
jgi:hypothetical protein